jgi:hypothetical protein
LYIGRVNWKESGTGWMVSGIDEVTLESIPYGNYSRVGNQHNWDRDYAMYIDSIYWAIVTMSSVGYGDLLPTTTGERTASIVVIVIGAFMCAETPLLIL